jgi:all-trans-retinol 13,14-reductase
VTADSKIRYWSHEVPDGEWDYIVVGSGMGGMAAAALLSKLGRRVLVIEQHVIPGGFTQTFKRPGYHWDVGVHLVGEMTDRSYVGRLLSNLTDGRLEWASVGEIYDEFNFPDGFTIQFPNSKPAFRDTLCEYFPDEGEAIDRYLDLVRSAARASAGYLQARVAPMVLAPGAKRKTAKAALPFVRSTTAEVLHHLTDDHRLRSVLAAQWGYYGSTPEQSSFAMHALMVAHFLWGAFYPVGSAASIAREMLRTVADSGGWTLVRTEVDEIVVRGGKATGVHLGDGREISARKVISAAGAPVTARMLPDGTIPIDESSIKPGPAHVSLYIGFEGDVAHHGGARYSQWFYETWDMERDIWDVTVDASPGRADVLYCSFPSLKDPAHDPGPELRQTGEVITFVPWESFEPWLGTRWKKRPEAYDAFKETISQALLDQYLEHYPELAPMVTFTELSTPLSTHHFARSHRGSIYGLASQPERFIDESLSPKTPVRNLFMAGVDVMAPGIAGALGGGALAVAAAEPAAAMRYLRPIMKGPRAPG